MAAETVRVYAVDESSTALAGVLVRFFTAGGVFVTQGYTVTVGDDAYAEVTLEGDTPPISYTIRLSKNGVAFDGQLGTDSQTPQTITIYSPPDGSPSGTNDFQVQGQTFTRPTSPNPRLCRCSGFFKDASGAALANLDIHFLLQFNPIIVDGEAVLGSKVIARTDAEGYMELDLYRNGEYEASVQSYDDINRTVVVPDAPSANLVALLFPVVQSITFDPTSVELEVDEYDDVTVTVLTSSGVELDIADNDVLFTSEDLEVATVQIVDGLLRVLGVGEGTTTITADRADTSIVTVPDDLDYTPLDVTVTVAP